MILPPNELEEFPDEFRFHNFDMKILVTPGKKFFIIIRAIMTIFRLRNAFLLLYDGLLKPKFNQEGKICVKYYNACNGSLRENF